MKIKIFLLVHVCHEWCVEKKMLIYTQQCQMASIASELPDMKSDSSGSVCHLVFALMPMSAYIFASLLSHVFSS